MNRIAHICLVIATALAIQAFAGDWSYYRRDGSRCYLTPCDSLVTIKFADMDSSDQVLSMIQSGTALADDYDPVDVGFGFWLFGVGPGANLDTLIADLLTFPDVQLVNPVFELDNGKLMYASDQIILRAKPTASQLEIESLFDSQNLVVVTAPDSVAPFYVVSLAADSPPSVFSVADSLFESNLCRYSTPNCYGDIDEPLGPPNDTYYP